MNKETQAKSQATRAATLSPKQKAFTKEYVKTKNGTKAIKAAGYDVKSDNVAGAIASENLQKPKIREEIARLLADADIELANVLSIHKRNLEQNKHFPTSQKAVNDYYELVGLKDQPDTAKVNIAFIIEK